MDKHGVVIVGAGLGGARVAGQLRQRGYSEAIVVIGAESHRPYDRPPLRKQILRGELETSEFGDTNGLDVRWVFGTRAVSLDAASCKVLTEDQQVLGYDTLVLTPGARPRKLPGLRVGSSVSVLSQRSQDNR